MKTVFVPQNVRRLDRSDNKLKPMLDLSAAAAFGQLKEVIGESVDVLFAERVVSDAKDVLAQFKEGDYLLAVGDPTVIAVCAGILFKSHSTVKMLKWDRKLKIYLELELKL